MSLFRLSYLEVLAEEYFKVNQLKSPHHYVNLVQVLDMQFVELTLTMMGML